MVQRLAARDQPAAPFASHESGGVRTCLHLGSFRDPARLGCRARTCSHFNSLVHLRGGGAGRVRFASRPRLGSLVPIWEFVRALSPCRRARVRFVVGDMTPRGGFVCANARNRSCRKRECRALGTGGRSGSFRAGASCRGHGLAAGIIGSWT